MEWNRLLCGDRIRPIKKREGSQDLRSEFEKDYHRIIGSASFRRLQDKTQVFPLDQSDFVRTRLTHSLEVSSFCKSLGQNIARKIVTDIKDESFDPTYQQDVCDILQCAGLLHDIGNPPFGHFGETAIREWFKENLPELQYESENGEKPKEEIQKEKSIDGEVIKKENMNNNDNNNNLKRTKLKESFDENEEEKYKENEFEDIKD